MLLRRALPSLAIVLAPLASGCTLLGTIAYYTSPQRLTTPEFVFPATSRVAVLIDPAREGESNPVFEQALTDRLREMFRDRNSKATFLPIREIVALRRRPEYRGWSIQRVGKELNATHVLYLRQERLVLRETPDHPILHPQVLLRAKVIDVAAPSESARVWPPEADGREITGSRPMQEYTTPDATDSAVRKLGYDVSYFVGYPFFEMDLEEKPPIEP
jgi:hypothetical protein